MESVSEVGATVREGRLTIPWLSCEAGYQKYGWPAAIPKDKDEEHVFRKMATTVKVMFYVRNVLSYKYVEQNSKDR